MIPGEMSTLFEPLQIGDVTLPNRIVMAPMGTGFGDQEGNVTDQMVAYYAKRAAGRPGLLIVEATSVDYPTGYLGQHGLRVDDDVYVAGLAKLAGAIKAEGVRASLQLCHAGRYIHSRFTGVQPVAPSPIPSRYTGETPRELSTSEVEDIIEEFGEAAGRAQEAGFDAVELMGATGYLFTQFLSPITNKRTDRFGGDVRARTTFAVEVIRSVRRKVGPTFPVSFKFSVEDYLTGGTTVEDSLISAQEVVSAGASLLHAWAGWHETTVPMLQMSVPRGIIVHLAKALKGAVDVPVIAVGRINDPMLAVRIIKEGSADLVAMARAFLADPQIVRKAAEGRLDEVRPCTACCHCFDKVMEVIKEGNVHAQVACAVNAEVGREWEERVKPAPVSRKILVVGGGPAGMEAAIVAAERGHKVTLWEMGDRLGGTLLLAIVPPHKEELRGLIDYMQKRMKVLDVDIHLGKEATPEAVFEGCFDEVVLATGSQPIIPDLPGIKEGKWTTALDVLRGTEVGSRVLIIGGGMVGCETAEYLAQQGKKVTIVEMLDRMAMDVGPTSRWVLMKRLRDADIALLKKTKFTSMEDGMVMVEGDGQRQTLEADTIVLAVGMKADKRLYDDLKRDVDGLHQIGDCVECKTIREAIHSGWEIGCLV